VPLRKAASGRKVVGFKTSWERTEVGANKSWRNNKKPNTRRKASKNSVVHGRKIPEEQVSVALSDVVWIELTWGAEGDGTWGASHRTVRKAKRGGVKRGRGKKRKPKSLRETNWRRGVGVQCCGGIKVPTSVGRGRKPGSMAAQKNN